MLADTIRVALFCVSNQTANLIKLGVDAAGGDFAPQNPIQGCLQALKDRPDIHITLFGPSAMIQSVDHARITPVEAPDIIAMTDSPVTAFRKKKHSAIHYGLNALKAGEIQGFISAGNTGAIGTTATLTIGRIPAIERPAIATVFPGNKGPVIVLDVGSTVDCKPLHLNQFAIMGHYFAICLGVRDPRIGLLNIGEEDEKGNQVAQETFRLLRDNTQIQFIGNIEGRDVLSGHADVIICDGFVGNIMLKFGEGVVTTLFQFFKQEIKGLRYRLGAALMAPVFKNLKKKYQYDTYGSAPLLGIQAPVFIAHGSSSARALGNGIISLAQAVETGMTDSIRAALD